MINNKKNNDMKEAKIEIEIPDGKMAQWVNNVLTLVDEKPQNVMERIKTFEDALNELRDRAKHGDEEAEVLVNQYDNMNLICSKDLLAYIKLCIIASALNEGWKPKFDKEEYRYYTWYYIYSKEQYNNLSEEQKKKCYIICRGGYDACASVASSSSYTGCGSRLAFKSKELAEYAGKQFIDIYADYFFNTNERLLATKPREMRDIEIAASKK